MRSDEQRRAKHGYQRGAYELMDGTHRLLHIAMFNAGIKRLFLLSGKRSNLDRPENSWDDPG
jgi:hypothetical protein